MAKHSGRLARPRRNSLPTPTSWGWRSRIEELEPRLFLAAQGISPDAEWGSHLDGSSYFTTSLIPIAASQLPVVEVGAEYVPAGSIPVDNEDDPEDTTADEPVEVAGSFLYGRAPTDISAISFNDVLQGQLDTCVFASTLSAVVRTEVPIQAGIIALDLPEAAGLQLTAAQESVAYQVKLYKQNAQGQYVAQWIDVPFDFQIQTEDLRPADSDEFWPALYQRAFLKLAQETGLNYHSGAFALSALTGAGVEQFVTTNGGLTQALRIEQALDQGRAVTASTIDSPQRLLDNQYGIVHLHSYTVMGIEIPASGNLAQTYVTVRNPWGRDTLAEFFDVDDNDALDWGEWEALQYGVDGLNDGLIRLPWSSFATFYDDVTISKLTGPSLNQPLKVNNPPVFTPNSAGPFTIHEGERLEVGLHAADPDGLGLNYSLAPGSPGNVHLQNGQYIWEPLAGDVGTYSVTVIAEVSPFEKTSLTFQVNVSSGAPQIGSLTANVNSIGDAGTDQLTLTANNVTLAFDTVDRVEFWQDSDGNGTFNDDIDRFLGYGQQAGSNWSWSGYIGSVTPGSVKFFTRAGWFSFSDLHYSAVLNKSITITATPVVPPVATAGSAIQITPTTTGVDQKGFAIEADAAGNLRTFWLDEKFVPTVPGGSSGNFQYGLHTRLYGASGVTLSAAQMLVNYPGPSLYDAEVLPDGSFIVAWIETVSYPQSNLKAQRYDANANPVGSVISVVANAAWAQNQSLEIAADASGNFVCVYNKGDYFDEDSFAVSVSSGNVVTRAPWQVNTSSVSEQKYPAVALNSSGNGVIVWNDGEATKIKGRLISNYGLTNGAAFEIAADSNVFDQVIDVAIDSNGNFVVSWEDNGVYARRFNNAGTPLGNAFRVNTNQAGGRSNGLISISDSGWTAIGWTAFAQDTGTNPGNGVYAQLFDPSGAAAGPEFAVPANLQNNQSLNGLYMDGDADVTFLWRNSLVTGSGDDISFIRQFSINLAPTFATNPTFNLPENSAVDTVVGSVGATDLDTPSGLTYSIVSGNLDNAFVINSATGQIRVADEEVLNFEDVASYDLVVRVVDPAGKSDLANVTINLTDVNEAPDLLDLVFTLMENSTAGTLVGDAGTAIDQDEADPITYSLLPGGDAGLFVIDPTTGQIFVGATAVLNFEINPNLSMTLKAADSSGLFETATVFVNLANRIEPPTIVPNSQPVHFTKKGGPSPLLPDVTLTASEAFSSTTLPGAQLIVSINRASKKGKFFDTLTGFDVVSGIGVLLSQAEVGGRTVFTIKLSDTVTVEAVQNYLRGLSFSTTGAGLKLTTRLLKVQLIGTDNVAGNLIEQTISVRKK